MPTDPLKHVEERIAKVHRQAETYASSVFARYPLTFSLLGTFSFIAVLSGFEGVVEDIPLLADHPLILLTLGLITLLFTGSLYKKLNLPEQHTMETTHAHNFTLSDQNGTEHTLSDYQGTWVLLYFYPKDDTPGCTKEACAIRDVWGDFGSRNAIVFGISADSVESHKRFSEKYTLPFTLLADPEKQVIKAYDAQRATGGTKRISYLINPQGEIAKTYLSVKPLEHAQQVLDDIDALS